MPLNPGLVLDKPRPENIWPEDRRAKTEYVRKRLSQVAGEPGEPELLNALRHRHSAALAALGALTWTRNTAGPLALHLARANAFENAGLCLHPVYGFAYIPGTGLKGLARSYAETLGGATPADTLAVFGNEPPSPKQDRAPGEEPKFFAGAVVFHDALPVRWPKLGVDIVNNHHSQYYQGQGEQPPPADWEDPIPVNFLVVRPGAEFEFSVSPRRKGEPENARLLKLAREWLEAGLAVLGAGAKTNAGYGRFATETAAATGPPAVFACKLTLVSPAFLAGAMQDETDCDLRSATVRGLLRWWWRAMHAGRLSVAQLRRLEGELWGTTESGSPIAIEVRPASPCQARKFDPAEVRRQCGIAEERQPKRTQGFRYLSYGMSERDRGRYFLPAGCCWDFTVSVRRRLEPPWGTEEILRQAVAALACLSLCGGVGSKSRRGFGSLDLSGSSMPVPSSLEDILGMAALPISPPPPPAAWRSSALNHLVGGRPLEIELSGYEPWFALDQLGRAYQSAAAKWRHKPEKLALGLPRKINDPRGNEFLPHPTKPKAPRHASPLHFRLVLRSDERHAARLTAFIDPLLPDAAKSEAFLRDVLGEISNNLKGQAEVKAPPPPPAFPVAPVVRPPAPPPSGLKAGEVTHGVLSGRTKKGGWLAREERTGETGPVQNWARMPAEQKEGDRVLLKVKISKPGQCAFDWTGE